MLSAYRPLYLLAKKRVTINSQLQLFFKEEIAMNIRYYFAGLLTVIASSTIAQENSPMDVCRNAAGKLAQGEMTKIELEKEKGMEVYEIEIKSADGNKWEIKCDKASGKIIETEQELTSADHPAFVALKKIDEAQARKIALEAHPGTISEVEYEIENGIAIYEFEIKMADGTEMEVEVDAAPGKIVKAEKD
jgi:uncharacterized membrane protein YkoI